MQLTARALKLLELIVVLTLFVAIQCVNGSTSFLEQCLGAIAIGSATLDSPAIIQCTRAQLLAPLIYNTSDGSITRITNCVFFGCGNIVASTPLVLSNVVFHKSTYAGKYSPTNTGGAMSLINTTATMYNVTFEGCGFVGNGGALFIDSNSRVNITNSSFTSQSRVTFGSAIYFQTNSSSSTITNTLFISNVAQAGGAIYFQSGSSCNIANSSFILNSVATGLHPQGGALFLESNSSVRISSSTFYGNSAQNGGSIYQSPDSRLTMDSSIFNASVGGESGGAIYIRSGNLTASNTLFNNCTSNYQASSIYMSGGASVILANVSVIGGYLTGGLTSNTLLLTHDVDLTVTNSSLIWDGGQSLGYSNGSHRLPISYGGVMTALSGSVVVLSNLHFSGQYVEGDGGILYVSDPSTRISITNVSFVNINVSGSGGILYASNSAVISFTNVSFSNISSMASAAVTKPVGGGVIYAELNCLISISNTTLQDIQSNGFGGAILLTHSSSMRANEMISNNTFSGGKLGGFMTALQGSTISCSWCLISNSGFKYLSALNSGEGQGGAFTILSSSSIFMQYSNISSSFGILGGAVAILSDSFGKFVYTNFIGNSATTASGAVAVFQSTALFDHVLFENNSAFIEGGALTLEIWDGYLYKAAFIGPVTFINNIVLDPLAGYGGAISMDTQSRLEINTTQLVMKGNKAAIGDAILCSNYFWGISNGTISYNPPASEVQAGLYPSIEGVIYLSQSAFALYTFENNPFIGVPGIVFDSPPATLAFANESITTKSISSSIGFDLVIPLIQIQLSNLFGNPIETINFTDPYIVKMIISSSSGSVLATFYKGILKAATPVKFQNIDLRNLTLPNSFDGVINLTFSLIHPLAEAVTFTLQPPDPPSSSNLTAMQIINAQVQQITRNNGNSSWSIFIPQCEIGTIAHEITPGVYKCVPLLTTMQSSLIVSGSLSGIFIVLTAALGVYAFSFKDIMVYRVKSSFFTVIITIGCLVQLISVLIRSFPSSAQCMASEWLELTGFMAVGASMWLKTYRIQLIILDPLASMAKTYVLKNAVLGMGVALGLFVSSMFLVAWTMIENISMSSVYVSSGSGGSANGLYPYGWIQTDRCKSSNGTFIFPIASACIHVALESALLYIAYVARRVMPLYNESRSISIVATVWLVCTIVFVAVELQVALLPDTLLAIQVVRIILPVVTTVILLHIPSALKVLMDPLGPLVNLGKLFSENLTDLSSQSYQTSDAASSTNAKFAATGVDYAEKYQVAKVAPTRVHVKKPPKIHSIGNASEISADSKEPPPPHY